MANNFSGVRIQKIVCFLIVVTTPSARKVDDSGIDGAYETFCDAAYDCMLEVNDATVKI
jgi:hypothetical protein